MNRARSSLLERVTAALFGAREPSADEQAERQLVANTIELVVDAVEPRVRHQAHYREKLENCMRHSIAYLRAMGRERFDPILLTRSAWATDPRVNAFFATADEVRECLGRSLELRGFFEDPSNVGIQEAYALLGMRKQERRVLAAQLEGDKLRQDVAQVTVSFYDHRLVAPSATLEATRLEIGRRAIRRLAQAALSRIVAIDTKATELEQRKASLGARLRLLKLTRDGMEGVVKDPGAIAQEIKVLEAEMKEAAAGYIEAKSSLATLDTYINHIDEVFSHPERHLALIHTSVRLNRMGFKVDDDAMGPVNELGLAELSMGKDLWGSIAIVRCPRSELPPKGDLLARAERYL